MTWDDLARDGFPERTSAVVNLAGRNFLDPLKRWTEEFKKDVIIKIRESDILSNYFVENHRSTTVGWTPPAPWPLP